jgi:hypothetical protein
MGKSQGTQKTTQTTELPKWYTDAAKSNIKFAGEAADNLSMPYMGNTVAGLDPIQQQAINAAGANIGSTNAGFQQAAGGAQAAMGYNPQQVGTGYQASMVDTNFNPQQISAGQQGYDYQPNQVKGSNFLEGDVGAYMSPYIQNVEQAAMKNMGQQLQQGINQIGDSALNAKAFGGSRQGVREGVAISDAARQMGDFSAGLRNQAFGQAQSMMQSDMDRRMQGDLANQQAGMGNAQFGANIGMQNIQNQLQAGQSNQNAWYQGAALNQQGQQANQQAGYQGAALNQQGALANQQAGLQGANLNLQGSQQLGQLTSDQQGAYLQSLNSALAAGQINQQQHQALLDQQQTQYDAMRNVPLEQLNIRMAPLQGVQVPTSTTSKTPTTGNGFMSALGGIGSIIGGLGTAGIISDKKAKTNIRKVGKDGLTGLDMFEYDYKTDVAHAKKHGKPMGPKRIGPMAQDIERKHPGSTRRIGGKLAVMNLGFGG